MTSPVTRKEYEYFTPETRPYGLTYGQWTVRWWQWMATIPTARNPAADENGGNAGINQIDQYVWFLAGTAGGKTVERNCIIPTGKAILFPVINYEINSIAKPELKTDSELIRDAAKDQDDIINLEAMINGQKIPIFRVRSDPLMFLLTLPGDNLFNTLVGGVTRATSDGYWVFLKPLETGEYNLYFAGSCSAGSRNVEAGYNIKVRNNVGH